MARVIVTVTDDGMRDMERVAQELTGRGLQVDSVLRMAGSITGDCQDGCIADLEAVPGVASVAEDSEITLPPFDPNVPQ